MKKLLIIFAGATMALVSCKNQTDGLASANTDDVYYNPAKDRKPNVAPQPEQYATNQAYDPNAGKIGATAADKNNPYYKDPNFNYDDYYDNAYAARIRRFNNPLYGTGYYDSYNTNAYFYNGNPNMYGTSIYNSYNMGYGYYSPSSSFWNSYYNPYYNGFGSSMGYGMGYGSGLSIGYGMGYGSGMGYGYNPYSMCNMGYGYGGYNPYAYGMGYSPYGYNPYGYGYGMGYGYNTMGYGGYYNSYDCNSNSYSHNGPRGTHIGGNSTTTSPMPAPHHMMVNQPNVNSSSPNAPDNIERFNQVVLPKDHFTKIQEAKNPLSNSMYSPSGTTDPGAGRPIYNNGNSYDENSYSHPTYNNNNPVYNNNSINGGVKNNDGNYSSPRPINNGAVQTPTTEPKPRRWFSGSDNNNGGFNNNPSYSNPTPNTGKWGGGGFGGGNSGGGSSGGSGGGGGVSRPHK